MPGSFRTPPAGQADVRLAFSADTCGQGWGIDEARGGLAHLRVDARRAARTSSCTWGTPIYADNPLPAEIVLDDGGVWRNLVTPAKAKVAETLDEFRGNHLYNRLDAHVRRFESEVSQVVLWDDHEVLNNWYPGEVLEDPRYTERSVDPARRPCPPRLPRALPAAPLALGPWAHLPLAALRRRRSRSSPST